jgi:hypothetical protein
VLGQWVGRQWLNLVVDLVKLGGRLPNSSYILSIIKVNQKALTLCIFTKYKGISDFLWIKITYCNSGQRSLSTYGLSEG